MKVVSKKNSAVSAAESRKDCQRQSSPKLAQLYQIYRDCKVPDYEDVLKATNLVLQVGHGDEEEADTRWEILKAIVYRYEREGQENPLKELMLEKNIPSIAEFAIYLETSYPTLLKVMQGKYTDIPERILFSLEKKGFSPVHFNNKYKAWIQAINTERKTHENSNLMVI